MLTNQRTVDLAGGATPIVAVDLRSASPPIATLKQLETGLDTAPPWVTVAVVDGETPAHKRITAIAERCDVVIADATDADSFGGVVVARTTVEDAMRQLTRAVEASPLAAVTLAQVLRCGATLSIEQALYVESTAYATLQTSERFMDFLASQRPARGTDDDPRTLIERRDSLLHITLTRAARRNALDTAMRDELTEAFELIDADDTLDGALWTGEGPSFCAGGDLGEFGTTPSPAVGHHVRTIRSLPLMVHRVRDRLRVHLHGSCVGAGIELPAFTHAVLADPATTFCLPEVGFGLVPGAGGTVSVAQRCGRHRAGWLALTGEAIDVQTALRWGLIDRIAERRVAS